MGLQGTQAIPCILQFQLLYVFHILEGTGECTLDNMKELNSSKKSKDVNVATWLCQK